MKKTLIVLGVVAVIGAGIYFYSKNKSQSSSSAMADSKDFDETFNTAKSVGSDWFEGSSAERLKQIRDNYIKSVTKNEHKVVVSLLKAKKPENSWSANDKIVMSDVMKKLAKGLNKS